MPMGIPRTDEERIKRHKMLYGKDSTPPAERTGRNAPGIDREGRPFGVPRTEEERIKRHKMLYGKDSIPPAERIGRNALDTLTGEGREGYYPVIIGEGDGKTKVIYVPQGEMIDESDLFVVSGSAIASYIIAHKLVTLALIAGAALIYGGLKAAQIAYEKIKRRGLKPFQLIVGAPKPEEIDDPDAKYTFGVVGAVPGRKVSIRFGKGKYFDVFDPVFREGRGDFMVEVTGRELAEAAKKRKVLSGRIPGLNESGDVTVSMYASEDRRPAMRDLHTPIEAVKIHIPSMREKVVRDIGSIIPCIKPPKSIPIEEANMGFAAGKKYYVKSALPLTCCLPGLPYTPGMWLPPGCVISEKI